MEQAEHAVIAQVRSGDGSAFRLLVDRHSRNLFRLAYRMTGNQQDAEDVVQETFFRAYRQMASYDERASFGTWLYRIAANYSLDLMRARRRRNDGQAPSEDGEFDAAQTIPDKGPDPERLALSGQMKERVEAAMETLSSMERTAFVLRHFEGISIEDIGQTLRIQPNAAKNTVFRAVRKLRRILEPFTEVGR